MARGESDWEEDDWLDDEGEEGDSFELDDETVMVACLNCRRQIYEEAEQCPHCGHFVGGAQRQPWWVWVGLLLAGYIIYRWVVG